MARQDGPFYFVGSVANITGQRTRNGYILRMKPHPTNPQSPKQMIVRQSMNTDSKNWSTLTQIQRDSWEYFASIVAGRIPGISYTGPDPTKTGYTLFMSCNLSLRSTQQLYQIEPPDGYVYDAFKYLGMNMEPKQTSPGSSNIEFMMDFEYNGGVGNPENFGGIYVSMCQAKGSVQPVYLSKSIVHMQAFDGLETSPETVTLGIPFASTAFPLDFWVQVQARDQAGVPAGVSQWYPVTMLPSP